VCEGKGENRREGMDYVQGCQLIQCLCLLILDTPITTFITMVLVAPSICEVGKFAMRVLCGRGL